MGKPGPKPKHTVDTTWRSELAYAVGLLASDGCLSRDGRHIELTSKDVDQLDTFKKILGIEHIKTGRKTSGYSRQTGYRVEFGSVLFFQWLQSIGLTPRKSHTISALKVPDKYYRDFLRGLFDGDGCIYSYWDSRWKSSYVFYVEYVSASEEFLKWLQCTNQRLFAVTGVIKPMSTCRTCSLKHAKRESRILLNEMYHRNKIPCLARKFTKVQNILMIDTMQGR